MSTIRGGLRRSLGRDGLHEIHDDQGLVLKSTLRVVDEVVSLAREKGWSLSQALDDLIHEGGFGHWMEGEEFVHRLVWEGHSRESAVQQWRDSWRECY